MSETLYRKYRPQKWAEIVGQDIIVKTLTNELANKRTAHAYLFSGPRGVGKTTIARIFAKSLNCANSKDFEPCSECSACADIMKSRSIDVIEIDAASNTGVENVRENIIAATRFEPAREKYKVFIIDEVHMLSNSAFNALLKTLEEPPARTVFILATTEAHKLPETIISRCERFTFKRIEPQTMILRLSDLTKKEGIKIDEPVLARIAHLSEGCIRDAESILGQVISAIPSKKITSESVEQILPKKSAGEAGAILLNVLRDMGDAAIRELEKAYKNGASMMHLIDEIISILKDGVVLKIQNFEPVSMEELPLKDELIYEFKLKKLEEITKLAKTIIKERENFSNSPIPTMPLMLWIAENISTENNSNVATTAAHKNPSEKPNNKAIKNEAPQDSGSEGVSLDVIKSAWQNYIANLDNDNHSMKFLLSSASIEEWRNGKLILSFEYQLLKDKVLDRRNKFVLEEALSNALKTKVTLDAIIRNKSNDDNFGIVKLQESFEGQIMD